MWMKLRKSSAVLLALCLILSLALVQKENPFRHGVTTSIRVGYHDIGNPLNLTSRANIYSYVQSNPGIHLRQICNDLSISIGSAQYHLDRLVEGDLLESEKESKYRRFYESNRFTGNEKTLIALLNRKTTRKIIEMVIRSNGCSHMKIAEGVGISSQAVTWQVKRLIEKGIVTLVEVENSKHYFVNDNIQEIIDKIEVFPL